MTDPGATVLNRAGFVDSQAGDVASGSAQLG
jgi:hypothetical protein